MSLIKPVFDFISTFGASAVQSKAEAIDELNHQPTQADSSQGVTDEQDNPETTTNEISGDNEWKIPPMPDCLLPEPPKIGREYLPESVREYVFHSALQLDDAPPEYVAIGVIAAAATTIGGSAVVAPKKNDKKWKVVPTIWAAAIGGPSLMKTPALNAGLQLIPSQQDDGEEDNSLVVNDATRAALAVKLANQPKGILMSRDELSGWLTDLEDKKNRSERGFYLSAFNGNVSHYEIRVTRGKVKLESAIVSILGGIQPSMLAPFLKERLNGKLNDGLFERFQLAVYPNHEMRHTDIASDEKIEKYARHAFERLMEFRLKNNRKVFHFTPEAQERFDGYQRENHARRVKADPHLQAVLGKYSALCAKLALIFHLLSQNDVNDVPDVIGDYSLQMALRWVSLVEAHYHRLMRLAEPSSDEILLQMLIQRLPVLAPSFSKRDLRRKEWQGVTSLVETENALDLLERHGFIKKYTESPHGRSRIKYKVHPDYC